MEQIAPLTSKVLTIYKASLPISAFIMQQMPAKEASEIEQNLTELNKVLNRVFVNLKKLKLWPPETSHKTTS